MTCFRLLTLKKASSTNQSRERILDENLEPESLLNGLAPFRVESLMRLVWLYP